MSKKQQVPTQDTHRYHVFVVDTYIDKQDQQQTDWLRVGVAFPHKDGKGFNVQVRALPGDGRLVIRLNEPQDKVG
jgi:hypothetical protein